MRLVIAIALSLVIFSVSAFAGSDMQENIEQAMDMIRKMENQK